MSGSVYGYGASAGGAGGRSIGGAGMGNSMGAASQMPRPMSGGHNLRPVSSGGGQKLGGGDAATGGGGGGDARARAAEAAMKRSMEVSTLKRNTYVL